MTGTTIPSRPHRRTVRLGQVLLVVGVALVAILAAYAVYAALLARSEQGANTLVVYGYPSLFGGNCGNPNLTALLASFDREYGATVRLECPGGTLISTLLAEKNSPAADVVIGLDEVTAPEAEANGLLLPYIAPSLAHVPAALVAELSPAHAVTPYEWGYLAFDYTLNFDNASHGAIDRPALETFATNASWSSGLIVENPTLDITGEEFLLWEIEYYTQVLHQDWRTWWQAAAPHLTVSPSWSLAFGSFTTPGSNLPMVVSYSTDPAYGAYYGGPVVFNSTVSWSNGTAFGWKTIYGVGVVSGTHHRSLAEAFVNWFLGGTVQNQIPLNEWEYPANDTIPLPSVYNWSLSPRTIVALNDGVSPSTIASSLATWLNDWQAIENQYG